jgi:chromosome partitioning protein
MTKIISIANQKGGVGKTTTAFNIAAGLKKSGKKVLLVDLDPQGNLSQYLGFKTDGKETIGELMNDAVKGETPNVNQCIRTSAEGIDYIPSSISLSSADFFLITAMSRESVLKKVLSSITMRQYDYIIIDCLPSLGILLINALAASDSVIIPVQAQKFALDGLVLLLNIIKMVKSNINPQLDIKGILITMTDNTNMAKAVEESLKNDYGNLVFKSKISRSVEATNSTYEQKSLISSKHSKLGQEYMNAAHELIERGC